MNYSLRSHLQKISDADTENELKETFRVFSKDNEGIQYNITCNKLRAVIYLLNLNSRLHHCRGAQVCPDSSAWEGEKNKTWLICARDSETRTLMHKNCSLCHLKLSQLIAFRACHCKSGSYITFKSKRPNLSHSFLILRYNAS